MEEAGTEERNLSTRTVTRYLNTAGYLYLQARKKAGLMTEDDHRLLKTKHAKKISEQMFGRKKLLST